MPQTNLRFPFYQYVHANQMPTPGAMAYAFESEMQVWKSGLGSGVGQQSQFAILFPAPQSYQAVSVAWLTGLQGVAHGQSALAPLINPYGG